MDIENIVENTCSRATVEFQAEVDAEFVKQSTGLDNMNASMSRCLAIEKALPAMLKTALTAALSELAEKIEEQR